MNEKLQTLKLKKARIIDEIESLETVNQSVYTQLGKVVFDIHKLEKQIIRETKNNLDDHS